MSNPFLFVSLVCLVLWLVAYFLLRAKGAATPKRLAVLWILRTSSQSSCCSSQLTGILP